MTALLSLGLRSQRQFDLVCVCVSNLSIPLDRTVRVTVTALIAVSAQAFTNTTRPAQQYLRLRAPVQNLAGMSKRLEEYNAVFGIGECRELPAV